MSAFLAGLLARSREVAPVVRPRVAFRFEISAPTSGAVSQPSIPVDPGPPASQPLRPADQDASALAPMPSASGVDEAAPRTSTGSMVELAHRQAPHGSPGERPSSPAESVSHQRSEPPVPDPALPGAELRRAVSERGGVEDSVAPRHAGVPVPTLETRAVPGAQPEVSPGSMERSHSASARRQDFDRSIRSPAAPPSVPSVSAPLSPEPTPPPPSTRVQASARSNLISETVRAAGWAEARQDHAPSADVAMPVIRPSINAGHQAPTIRVSIGRVEVRAIRTQAPTARAAAEPQQPRQPALSLDDYLARRDGRVGRGAAT